MKPNVLNPFSKKTQLPALKTPTIKKPVVQEEEKDSESIEDNYSDNFDESSQQQTNSMQNKLNSQMKAQHSEESEIDGFQEIDVDDEF